MTKKDVRKVNYLDNAISQWNALLREPVRINSIHNFKENLIRLSKKMRRNEFN